MAKISNPRPALCVDGRLLSSDSGVGRYTNTVISAMRHIAFDKFVVRENAQPRDNVVQHAWAVACGISKLAMSECVPLNHQILSAPTIFKSAQVRFDILKKTTKLVTAHCNIDIAHWAYPVPVYFHNAINIYTIHDVIPLTHPQLCHTDPSRLTNVLNSIRPYADAIITVSEYSRDMITQNLGFARSFVHNCGIGIELNEINEEVFRPENYFLYCGSDEPRKNVSRLVQAYIDGRLSSKLILVGDHLSKYASRHKDIICLPNLDRADLLGLMKFARALVFPTLAEGFGLPVAEAITLGTPVITSNIPVMHETAGPAAIYAEPYSTQSIRAAMSSLESRPELEHALRIAAQRQSHSFSMKKFAKRLERVYAHALVSKRRP